VGAFRKEGSMQTRWTSSSGFPAWTPRKRARRSGLLRSGIALPIAALALGASAAAAEDAPDRRVGFSVERSREVANDWVTAVLSASHEDPKAAEVASRINRDMGWAMGLAKARSAVRTRSGGYSTHPVHDPERQDLRHWRGVQEIVLESADVEAVTALVGELQERLQVQSLGFSVSPERRRAIEEELVAEALTAFQQRAELVRKSFAAGGYRLVEVHVGTAGGGPPPVRPMMRAMAAEAEMMPPALEGGTSEISVSASGSIELK
jgi:predicted secreted protein